MAFHYSPKVVTDGLVLTLDASNPKCMVNGASTATDLAGKYTLQGLSGTGLSVVKYTPSDAGNPAVGAVDFTNDGTTYPYIDDQGQFDFRSEISWMCIACKETDSTRQSIWSAIEDVSPWDGAGLISYSHDNNGKLAWWSGNNYGGWWDTSITSQQINGYGQLEHGRVQPKKYGLNGMGHQLLKQILEQAMLLIIQLTKRLILPWGITVLMGTTEVALLVGL